MLPQRHTLDYFFLHTAINVIQQPQELQLNYSFVEHLKLSSLIHFVNLNKWKEQPRTKQVVINHINFLLTLMCLSVICDLVPLINGDKVLSPKCQVLGHTRQAHIDHLLPCPITTTDAINPSPDCSLSPQLPLKSDQLDNKRLLRTHNSPKHLVE